MGRDVVDFNQDAESATNTGQAVVAIDPSAFGEVAAFKAAVDKLVRELRASERLPGVERIYMPGEQSHERILRQRRDGIAIAPQLVQTLDRLAQQLEIPPLRTN
jgi:LDH2 family malate/lactate/ureidoglycolate dehydrogenase